MLYYFDSSAAVKRYAAEKGSEWVKSIVEPIKENTVCLAQVGIVEIAAALSKKVRTKERITPCAKQHAERVSLPIIPMSINRRNQ